MLRLWADPNPSPNPKPNQVPMTLLLLWAELSARTKDGLELEGIFRLSADGVAECPSWRRSSALAWPPWLPRPWLCGTPGAYSGHGGAGPNGRLRDVGGCGAATRAGQSRRPCGVHPHRPPAQAPTRRRSPRSRSGCTRRRRSRRPPPRATRRAATASPRSSRPSFATCPMTSGVHWSGLGLGLGLG